MNKLLIFLILLLHFGISVCRAEGRGGNLPVTYFQYYYEHVGLLVKQSSIVNPDSCQRADIYILPKTHPYYKEMVSLIMASHLTGQPLTFSLRGCVQSIPMIAHMESFK